MNENHIGLFHQPRRFEQRTADEKKEFIRNLSARGQNIEIFFKDGRLPISGQVENIKENELVIRHFSGSKEVTENYLLEDIVDVLLG